MSNSSTPAFPHTRNYVANGIVSPYDDRENTVFTTTVHTGDPRIDFSFAFGPPSSNPPTIRFDATSDGSSQLRPVVTNSLVVPTEHPSTFQATIETNLTTIDDSECEFLLDYQFSSYEHFGFKPTILSPNHDPFATVTLTHRQTLDLYRFLRAATHDHCPDETTLVFPDGRAADLPRPIDELDPTEL